MLLPAQRSLNDSSLSPYTQTRRDLLVMHGETAHRTPLLRVMRFSVHPAQFFNVCYSVNAVVFQGKTNLTVTGKPFGQDERADRFPF